MKTKWMILFVLIFFSAFLEAQDKKANRYLSLREKLFSDMQIFERTFQNDSDFLQLEQDMRHLLQEQLKNSFSDDEIQNFLGPMSEGPQNNGSLEWSETDTSRILKVKVKMPKDQALDIKIEKSQIKISGQIKKTNQIEHFSQIVSVPSDCDGSQSKIEVDKEGYAQIVLPKRVPTKIKSKAKPHLIPDPQDEMRPVKPSGNGVAI